MYLGLQSINHIVDHIEHVGIWEYNVNRFP